MRSFKEYLKEDFEQLKELKDFKLEVACDEKSLTAGLSERTSISPDGGMLFIFPESQIQCLWMANCLVEMDVIFLDSQTRVTAIHRMKVEPPRSPYEDNAAYENRLPLYSSGRSAKFAVELAAGTLDRLDIRVDSRINLARYLGEAIRGQDKWWYNTKTRKVVKIKTDFHDQAVAENPEKFGFTKDFLATKLRLTIKQFDLKGKDEIIPALDHILVGKGWNLITWSRGIKQLTVRGDDFSDMQKSVKWFLNKIDASPDSVIIDSNKTDFHKLHGSQIDRFSKTGKVGGQTDIGSTMARFR